MFPRKYHQISVHQASNVINGTTLMFRIPHPKINCIVVTFTSIRITTSESFRKMFILLRYLFWSCWKKKCCWILSRLLIKTDMKKTYLFLTFSFRNLFLTFRFLFGNRLKNIPHRAFYNMYTDKLRDEEQIM